MTLELPTMHEAAAVMQAADTYARTMGGQLGAGLSCPVTVGDLPAVLAELAAALERVRAVVTDG